MLSQIKALFCAIAVTTLVASPAHALTQAECSVKYQSAKEAGQLNGMSWNDFRKSECGAGASSEISKTDKASKSAAKADEGGKGLSMKECSAKYQAAKDGGTLNGQKWNDFRKASCGAGASDDDTVPSFDEANYSNEPETPATKAPRGVTFPTKVDRKFANESPGKQRLHTCLAGYYENKDGGTLNGLHWIQKGGGYYSICNQLLKAGS